MATGYIVAAAGPVRAFRKSVNWSAALRYVKASLEQSDDGRLQDLPTTQYWIQAVEKGHARGAPFDVRSARRWYAEQPNTPPAVRKLAAKDDPAAFEGLVADETVCRAEDPKHPENPAPLRGIPAAIAILRNLGDPTDLPIIGKLKPEAEADL
jgi:hypothetical protein